MIIIQNPELQKKIVTQSIDKLFESDNLILHEKKNPKIFNERIS